MPIPVVGRQEREPRRHGRSLCTPWVLGMVSVAVCATRLRTGELPSQPRSKVEKNTLLFLDRAEVPLRAVRLAEVVTWLP